MIINDTYINSISVLISIFIRIDYIGQYKHKPVVAIVLVSMVEEMVVDTISVLISIFLRSENSITYYINIRIITVTSRKLFASSIVSTSLIVEGAGKFTSLLIRTYT